MSQPDWDQAKCQGTDDLFYPDKGGGNQKSIKATKLICTGTEGVNGEVEDECPIRAECLNFALATKQRFGIWGGMSERERTKERRRREAADELRKRAEAKKARLAALKPAKKGKRAS